MTLLAELKKSLSVVESKLAKCAEMTPDKYWARTRELQKEMLELHKQIDEIEKTI